MKYIICLASCLSLSLFSIIGVAADGSEAKILTSSPVNTGAMLETLLGLVLVLACIAFLAWLLRRTGRFNSSGGGEMKIIAGLSLGPRERAILLQVGEKQILVGVTAQQIQTLHVLEQPINTSKEQTDSSSFADRLQQMMQQRGKS
jgi:flagellar protein FliO/FliZ